MFMGAIADNLAQLVNDDSRLFAVHATLPDGTSAPASQLLNAVATALSTNATPPPTPPTDAQHHTQHENRPEALITATGQASAAETRAKSLRMIDMELDHPECSWHRGDAQALDAHDHHGDCLTQRADLAQLASDARALLRSAPLDEDQQREFREKMVVTIIAVRSGRPELAADQHVRAAVRRLIKAWTRAKLSATKDQRVERMLINPPLDTIMVDRWEDAGHVAYALRETLTASLDQPTVPPLEPLPSPPGPGS